MAASPSIRFHDSLRQRAASHPHAVALTFLGASTATEPVAVTYGELDRRARAIAGELVRRGLTGERALLLHPPGPELVASFFACLYAGVIAVPSYPPGPATSGPVASRVRAVAGDAQAAAVLATEALVPGLQAALVGSGLAPAVAWIGTDAIPTETAGAGALPDSDTTVAFLQYTSGSTGDPKGVVVTHRNLIDNSERIRRAFAHDASDRGVIWLPPYHDMGLIGGILQPIYAGFPVTLTSPMVFVRRPLRWVELISETRATISGAPNFAYDLCLRAAAEADLAGLDLSSWRVAFSGAEPVRADTLARFAQVFAACGFRERAFLPVYGLAEATLLATASRHDAGPVRRHVDTAALSRGYLTAVEDAGTATGAPGNLAGATCLVGCGSTDSGLVHIVNPETRWPVPDGQVGEIWISSASVAAGYWNRPDLSDAVFGARLAGEPDGAETCFLRSGDLGVVHEGELFVTGRIKDLIIVRGRNIYPQDVEHAVEASHPAVIAGGCAAFSVDLGEREALAVVAEVKLRDGARRRAGGGAVAEADLAALADEIVARIRGRVGEIYDLAPAIVALVRPRTLPRTSSGKLRRQATRTALLSDELARIDASQAPGRSFARDPAAPRTLAPAGSPVELALRAIWARILGVRVDLDDDFFALGGDSVEAGRIAAMAADAGLHLSVRDALERRTVRSLAHAVGNDNKAAFEQRYYEGPVVPPPALLMRAQQQDAGEPAWDFRLLELPRGVGHAQLAEAVRALASAHDLCRLRRDATGAVIEAAAWSGESTDRAVENQLARATSLAHATPEEHLSLAEQHARELAEELLRDNGSLIRFGHVDRGPAQPPWALVVARAGLLDDASWRIMARDLDTACQQLLPPRGAVSSAWLPPQTGSVARWLIALADRAAALDASSLFEEHWGSLLPGTASGPDARARAAEIALLELPAAPLERAAAALGVDLEALLLTAHAAAWRAVHGHGEPIMLIQRDARDLPGQAVDLTRTAGALAFAFPIRCRAPSGKADLGPAARTTHATLAGVPLHGLLFDAVCAFASSPALSARAASMRAAQSAFRLSAAPPEGGLPVLARGGADDWTAGMPPFRLACIRSAHVIRCQMEGPDRATVAALVQSLASLLAPEAEMTATPGPPRPSDFPLARIDDARLASILDKLRPAR